MAERAGVPPERSESLWRALGFTRAEDDDVVFGDADVRALELVKEMSDAGLLDEEREIGIARSVGRSFNRLAEWQTRILAEFAGTRADDSETLTMLAQELIPKLEEVQSYVWRRALISQTSRMLLRPSTEEGTVLAVGFCDIVGYTSQSRRLSEVELEALVERFENVSNTICTEHGGRIIKTIGDEVLFVADTPADGARIGLELVERHLTDEGYPLVRAGVAYGPVLSRLGDVFGSVVNIAARLTTVAHPGRVLVDRGLREALLASEEFDVRRMRRTSVKGFDRLEPFRLKHAREGNDEPETVEDVTPDVVRRRRT